MYNRPRKRRGDSRTRPYREIELELTYEEVLGDLDPGWLPKLAQSRAGRPTKPRRAE